MKRIVFTRPDDGGVSVVIPSPRAMKDGESEIEFLERMKKRSVPPGADVMIVEEGDIPSNREFRNAWKVIGKGITHDLEKAKEIVRDRIRAARILQLEALDIEYQKADEKGDTDEKTKIAAKKQALRDAPANPEIANATSLADLRGLLP